MAESNEHREIVKLFRDESAGILFWRSSIRAVSTVSSPKLGASEGGKIRGLNPRISYVWQRFRAFVGWHLTGPDPTFGPTVTIGVCANAPVTTLLIANGYVWAGVSTLVLWPMLVNAVMRRRARAKREAMLRRALGVKEGSRREEGGVGAALRRGYRRGLTRPSGRVLGE